MKNLLDDVQHFVADELNAQLSGVCPFVVENKKSVDFEIKNALGRQGIVALVMTPKATYLGKYEDKMLAWQLDELEIDIVENVHINRNKPLSAEYATALDVGMEVFNILCPLSGEHEGRFCPVSLEEGEDGNLLVVKCILKAAVYGDTPEPPPPFDPAVTYLKYAGSDEWVATSLSGSIDGEQTWYTIQDKQNLVEVRIGTGISQLGSDSFYGLDYPALKKLVFADGCSLDIQAAFGGSSSISAVENFGQVNIADIDQSLFSNFTALVSIDIPESVTKISNNAFSLCESLPSVVVPSSCTTIEYGAFSDCSSLKRVVISNGDCNIGDYAFEGCQALEEFTVVGKTTAEVQQMENYPWGIEDTSVIHGSLG